jgi:outer membrane receptor for ferrienterochelin and colicin
MTLIRRFSLGLVFLTLAAPLMAQTANLEVLVVDRDTNAPLAAVRVEVDNGQVGFHASGATNAQGKVRFESLTTAGRYSVGIADSGTLAPVRANDLVLRSNHDQSVTLVASAKTAVSSEISVTAETSIARINTVDAEVASSLTQAEIETLPIEGRDLTRALYRLPNVTQATGFFPEAPNVSINGANSLYTQYLIDGLDNNENFLGGEKFQIPTGFSRDLTVLTNNYSSEYGRTANGVVNVTSRSGGNDFSGEAFYLVRPGPSIDGESPFAQRDLSGNSVKSGFRRNQFGAGLGGPVVRDRTFFFLDLEHTKDGKDNLLTSPALGVNETVRGTNTFNYYSGKIDQRWSDRFFSTLRGNLGEVKLERQAGGLEGGVTFPTAANDQVRDSRIVASNNVWTLDRVVPETNLQYSWFRWDYGRPETGDGPQVVVLDSHGQTAAILGHPGYVFDDTERSLQGQQKVTFALNDRNTLKAGAEVLSSRFRLLGGGNVNGNYTVMLTAAQEAALRAKNLGTGIGLSDIPADVNVLDYNIELQTRDFGATQTISGGYVEDLIAVNPRLNVTAGFRYDYDSLSRGGAAGGDRNNIAPRLSANYQLSNDSSLRAGYGIYYDKIVYSIYSDALQQNSTSPGFRSQIQQLIAKGILPGDTDLDRIFFDGNVSADYTSGVKYLHGPTPLPSDRNSITLGEARILNPNGYDNPYASQLSLGYQRQLGRNTLFYVDVMHNHSSNLPRLVDLNAPAAYAVDPAHPVVRTPAEANATRPVAVVPGGAQNIVVTDMGGQSKYYASTFNLVRDRGNGAYAYRLSYTLSKLTNNTEDINFKAADSNDYGAEWGPSINDRRHVLNAQYTWYGTRDLSISVAGLFQSGQPVNRIPDASIFGTTDLNGDGRSFGAAYVGNSDRFPGESRNSDRLPWSKTVDLGLQYRPSFSGFSRIELRADVFNVFDTVNLSGYSNNATQSNQIQVGASGIVKKNAGPPRQFQFGVRYLF